MPLKRLDFYIRFIIFIPVYNLGHFEKSFSYKTLLEASRLFEDDFFAYDGAWLEAYNNVDWKHLYELSTEEIKNKVIGFLNKWKCRLPYSYSLAENIRKAHQDSIPYIEALQDESIEDWAPNKIKLVEGKSYRNSDLLLKVYNRFVIIGEHFSYVAASKLFHFLLPRLAVMWDNAIVMSYGITMNSGLYVSKFIPKMSEMANEAIETYMIEKRCSREEAASALNRFRTPKTIAKLLDEYNYMKFTRGAKFDKPRYKFPHKMEVGEQLEIRAIEGRDGRVISRALDGRVILFDNTDPKSIEIKPGDIINVRVVRAAENYLIVRVAERPKPPELVKRYEPNPDELFEDFKQMKNFEAGEGIIEVSVDAWMADRRRAKEHYRKMFRAENLGVMSSEDFASFLYFRNNRAWTQLYRQGLQLTRNISDLRGVIAHLQDESMDIASRIRDALRGGDYHLRGFGKNIATGILHICDEKDQYGLWNNRTEEGLKRLKRKPLFSQDLGLSYVRINNELMKLKNELNTDLVMLDGFMWYLSKFKSEK